MRAMLTAVVLFRSQRAARAAEEGGSAADQPVGTVFKWIHFVILAGLAYWVLPSCCLRYSVATRTI